MYRLWVVKIKNSWMKVRQMTLSVITNVCLVWLSFDDVVNYFGHFGKLFKSISICYLIYFCNFYVSTIHDLKIYYYYVAEN